jgi:hypothetical protein
MEWLELESEAVCIAWERETVAGSWDHRETTFCEGRQYHPSWWNIITSVAPGVSSFLILVHVRQLKPRPDQVATWLAITVVSVGLMANAVSSGIYHAAPYRLYRLWDNLSLQWVLWWLATATAARDRWAPLIASSGYHGHRWGLGVVYLLSILTMAWYLAAPRIAVATQALSVILFGCQSLWWTYWSIRQDQNQEWFAVYSRRWYWMGGSSLLAITAYWLETSTCSWPTMYLHGVFHLSLSVSVFLLVMFILPLE